MTRKELAMEIYRMDELKTTHKCNEKEQVKRALNGIAGTKGFLKDEPPAGVDGDLIAPTMR